MCHVSSVSIITMTDNKGIKSLLKIISSVTTEQNS